MSRRPNNNLFIFLPLLIPSCFHTYMLTSFLRFSSRAIGAAVLVAAILGSTAVAHAQLQVELKLSRRSFILFEPLIATVTVTNNAGRDVELADDQNMQWFNIEVSKMGGALVPPYDPDYKLHPLLLPAGKSLQKRIDVTPLFPIREMGTHRMRAIIYFADTQKFFYSNYAAFDLTDGKLLWRQTVGVPGSNNEVRQVSLLTHQLTDRMMLYVRVRDEEGDNVYTTQSIGRLVLTGREPQEFFDRNNVLHVMQEAVPGTFMYTVVNLNGERLDQKAYVRSGTSRPMLVKSESGDVSVRGGQAQVTPTGGVGPSGRDGGAKLSDRPAGMPKPAAR